MRVRHHKNYMQFDDALDNLLGSHLLGRAAL